MIRVMTAAECGACSDGLITAVFPAAIAPMRGAKVNGAG